MFCCCDMNLFLRHTGRGYRRNGKLTSESRAGGGREKREKGRGGEERSSCREREREREIRLDTTMEAASSTG